MRKQLTGLFFLFLWASCTNNSSWEALTIQTGNPIFDTVRLRSICNPDYPSWTFELLKVGDRLEAFLNLSRPFLDTEMIYTVIINGHNYEEQAELYQGKMRVKLSEKITKQLISALQEGAQVAILINGNHETLETLYFKELFQKHFQGGLQ